MRKMIKSARITIVGVILILVAQPCLAQDSTWTKRICVGHDCQAASGLTYMADRQSKKDK
jgi:hypothetical protein